MEDMENSIIDIDCSDSKDPLAVVEYVDDIYAYYKATEVSFDLNLPMRQLKAEWVGKHYLELLVF